MAIRGEGFCGTISDGLHMASASCAEGSAWPVVRLGDVGCSVLSVDDQQITCTVPPKSPAVVTVHVDIAGLGAASGDFTFEFLIRLVSSSCPRQQLSA